MAKSKPAVVQVAGDPTVDWMLVAPPSAGASELEVTYVWAKRTSASAYAQPGGSALLTVLVAAVCSQKKSPTVPASVSGCTLPPQLLSDPRSPSVTRTFTVWEPHPRRTGADQGVWRMRTFLGQRAAGDSSPPVLGGECPEAPSCLVLDDANLGFREHREAWPDCLRKPARSARPGQVVLKMTNPIAAGPLWDDLVGDHAAALTVYFTLGDFRREDARVGQALSWEQISTDVVQAITNHKELSRVARVVVSLGASGAVVVEREGPNSLVFDPSCQEGDWERERPGSTMGLGTCIVASLVAHYARSPGSPDWLRGVRRGLQAARVLHEGGFTFRNTPDDDFGFPIDEVAEVLCGDKDEDAFQCVLVPSDERWEILVHAFPAGYRSAAEQIVLKGSSEACHGVPVEEMGSWASVDRTEIESMRSVQNIIREYVLQPSPNRPLSIAVFGPPGAGKSFAIKEMAREWTAGGSKMTVLEFNLSQFATTDNLAAAFRRLRDCAVEGTLPLVFWDEFDAPLEGTELGWLPQFLAPMQDGGFLEGGVFRPIGPAIFVFGGGTHATMASFKARVAERSEVKATDFLSRLRGFVDILGPNPVNDADGAHVLRRAFLLRALLQRRAPQILSNEGVNIDPGVLRAFLEVTAYVHGARSMESIIEMSSLSGKLRYERSALPAQHQLGLHVDAQEFLALVKQEAPS